MDVIHTLECLVQLCESSPETMNPIIQKLKQTITGFEEKLNIAIDDIQKTSKINPHLAMSRLSELQQNAYTLASNWNKILKK